jgi:HSP20 family protein
MTLARFFDDSLFPSFALEALRAFEDDFAPFDRRLSSLWSPSLAGPRFSSHESPTEWILHAEVPGMTQKDLSISVHDGAVSISGERKLTPPEGFEPRLQERLPMKFSRTFAVSNPMDWEKAEAKVADGILTLRIPKAPEAQPRSIPITTK